MRWRRADRRAIHITLPDASGPRICLAELVQDMLRRKGNATFEAPLAQPDSQLPMLTVSSQLKARRAFVTFPQNARRCLINYRGPCPRAS